MGAEIISIAHDGGNHRQIGRIADRRCPSDGRCPADSMIGLAARAQEFGAP
ncbi:MAG: hypothetical protein P4L82_18480 [Ancalomicrobiaceae bacterium]|nr:hypothetical protein [Ancalomicrobiaceae bacterium]